LRTTFAPEHSEVWLKLYEDEFEGVDAAEVISGHVWLANDEFFYVNETGMQAAVHQRTASLVRTDRW
jgi:hypothetical protein